MVSVPPAKGVFVFCPFTIVLAAVRIDEEDKFPPKKENISANPISFFTDASVGSTTNPICCSSELGAVLSNDIVDILFSHIFIVSKIGDARRSDLDRVNEGGGNGIRS